MSLTNDLTRRAFFVVITHLNRPPLFYAAMHQTGAGVRCNGSSFTPLEARRFNLPATCRLCGGRIRLNRRPKRPRTVVAAAAADRVGRPIKLVVKREQMFTSIVYRPAGFRRLTDR